MAFAALDAIAVRLLQPVRPMLADSANDVESALRGISRTRRLEYKLDGARVQDLKQYVAGRRRCSMWRASLDYVLLDDAARGRDFQTICREFDAKLRCVFHVWFIPDGGILRVQI